MCITWDIGRGTDLPAFRMAIKYDAKYADMPYRWACVGIKAKGRNRPQYKKKVAALVRTNGISRRGRKKSRGWHNGVFFWWFSLELTVRLVITSRKRLVNAQIRIAHPKSRIGIMRVIMIGKMIPPKPEPLNVTPRARARRRRNQVFTEVMLQWNRAAVPMGLQIPWARKN